MYPTLSHNDFFIFRRLGYTLQYGDIVIFENPVNDERFVKRVIGLPGDTIYIDVDTASVYRNNELLDEPYLGTPTTDDFDMLGEPFTVSDGHVFLMGDNRQYSKDSRSGDVGEIPADKILGGGVFVLWEAKGEPPYGIYE